MESKNELKETDIENRTCYYFDNIMRAWDIDIDTDLSGLLLDEKLYKEKNKNILIYDISYETSAGAKPLHLKYHKINGFIKIRNKIRYLVLFDDWCGKICGRTEYLISKKSGITDNVNYNFAIIKFDSHDSLPIEKILTLHNVIIFIKSVVNKNKNEYYHNIILEKGWFRIDVSEEIDLNKTCASRV